MIVSIFLWMNEIRVSEEALISTLTLCESHANRENIVYFRIAPMWKFLLKESFEFVKTIIVALLITVRIRNSQEQQEQCNLIASNGNDLEIHWNGHALLAFLPRCTLDSIHRSFEIEVRASWLPFQLCVRRPINLSVIETLIWWHWSLRLKDRKLSVCREEWSGMCMS